MTRRTIAVLGFLLLSTRPVDAQPCPPDVTWPRAMASGSASAPGRSAFGQNERGTLCGVGTVLGSVTGSSNATGTTVSLMATGGSTVSRSSASLERGELKATVDVFEPGGSGIAEARFRDRLFFTNTSAAYRSLRVNFRVDGSISGDLLVRDFQSFVGLTSNTGITPDVASNPIGFDSDLYGETIREAGNPHPHNPFQFRAQVGLLDWWSIDDAGAMIGPQTRAHVEGRPGNLDYLQSILLWVPPGASSLDLEAYLKVGPCITDILLIAGGCNFSNTGSFRLADISEDLTWTSESGVFLSGLGTNDPPIGVPEPSMPLLLVAGAGALAAARRRLTHAHPATGA